MIGRVTSEAERRFRSLEASAMNAAMNAGVNRGLKRKYVKLPNSVRKSLFAKFSKTIVKQAR